MRRADAPPAGWYPDPQGGARLRWWEGTDWTDDYRAPPSPAEQQITARRAADKSTVTPTPTPDLVARGAEAAAGMSRRDTDEIIAKVREAARSEIDRAADVFTQRARAMTKEFQPLVTEYTNQVLRWLRIIALVALVLVVAWFVFEAFAQATFFDWLGDRIDNLTD